MAHVSVFPGTEIRSGAEDETVDVVICSDGALRVIAEIPKAALNQIKKVSRISGQTEKDILCMQVQHAINRNGVSD